MGSETVKRDILRITNVTDDGRLYAIVALRQHGVYALGWDEISDEESDAFDAAFREFYNNTVEAAERFEGVEAVPESQYDVIEKKGRQDRFAYFIYAPSFVDERAALAQVQMADELPGHSWLPFSEEELEEEREVDR